ADEPATPSTTSPPPHHYAHPGMRFEKLDTDHDGVISKAEAEKAPMVAKHFDEIDTNHDGMISLDEWKAAMQAHMEKMREHLQQVFDAADINHDGRLSLEEAQKGMPRVAKHFAQLDANKDGYVTFEELLAGMKHHQGWRRPPAAPAAA